MNASRSSRRTGPRSCSSGCSPRRSINPRWSPDGKRVGFIVFDCLECITTDIYTMKDDGKSMRNLTENPDIDDFGTASGPR